MRGGKARVDLDDYERNIIIRALNEMRNDLIRQERTTDAVDDLMIKIHNAPERHMRICEERADEQYR